MISQKYVYPRLCHLSTLKRLCASLISLFSDPNAAPLQTKARQALLKYRALLTYADISHSALSATLPDIDVRPSRLGALRTVIRETAYTVLHPRFLLFLPMLPLHAPAYLTGFLSDKLLSTDGEEETRAQFKAVFGGLAATAVYAGLTRAIVKALVAGSLGPLSRRRLPRLLTPVLRLAWQAGWWFFDAAGGPRLGKAKAAAGVFGVFYLTSFFVSRWHNYWVGCECAVLVFSRLGN